MNLSEQLIILRKQKGWSQEQLGEHLNVTRQTVSKWEMGGYASAPVAIGDVTNGIIQIDMHQTLTPAVIRNAILSKFPDTPEFIVNLFSHIRWNYSS